MLSYDHCSLKGTYIEFKRVSDSSRESLFKRKPTPLRAVHTVGRRTVDKENQAAEVDNDLEAIVKPEVCCEWRQSRAEGSDSWRVMRTGVGIDFSHLADLKEGKYCEYFEMCWWYKVEMFSQYMAGKQ